MSGRNGTAEAGPKVRLATFQSSEFNVSSFVEGLMSADVQRAQGGYAVFKPQAHIATLENALSQLLPLRKANATKAAEIERNVAAAERAYKGDVRGAKAGFEAVSAQFQQLDTKVSKVGRSAVRIGEQLESLDRQKQRGSEAHDLIVYYNEFAQGDVTRLETLRKDGGREGRAKVAVALRRLMVLAREVEGINGAEETRDAIDKYCERFEKDMLRLFDRYYRKGDPKAMAHCAQTLQDFNGGQSCIQIYVNQHDFFISKERVQEAANSLTMGNIWEALPDPDAAPPKSESGLASLFDEIRVTVGQEAQIITAVFPNPSIVMQVFLQRVFAQVVQAYVEALIDTAASASTLAYLRILHLARMSTISLVNDIKTHDFFKSTSTSSAPSLASPLGAFADRNSQSLSASTGPQANAATGAGGSGVASVNAMLDNALEELFMPYMEGTRYLDRESKSLTELYAVKLLRFTNFHRATNKTKKPSNALFDRMVDQLATAAHKAAHLPAELIPDAAKHPAESSRLGSLMKISGLSHLAKDKGQEISPEMMFEDGDGDLDLAVAERMLKWHAEAVGRMVELSPSSEVPKNAFTLLKELAEGFGKAYIETALDTALHQLDLWDQKSEPILAPMHVLRLVDLMMNLWQRYVSTALIPLAGTSVTVRREMSIFNNHVVLRVEGKANQIVQKGTDVIVSWLGQLLGKQKKADFRPKNDDMAFSRVNTEPCLLACDFLGKVRENANSSMAGRNLDGFLTEVGVTFHSLLLDHLKKFQISAAGGLMLTKDLASYQDAISSFNVGALNDRFEMLRQLGNVFIVQPEILKQYLTESYLARIENRLLKPFVMMRTDYNEYGKRFWDDIFGPEYASGSSSYEGGGTAGRPGTADGFSGHAGSNGVHGEKGHFRVAGGSLLGQKFGSNRDRTHEAGRGLA